jgi:hypothetical protein
MFAHSACSRLHERELISDFLLRNVIAVTAPDVKVIAVNVNKKQLMLYIPRHVLPLAKDHRK